MDLYDCETVEGCYAYTDLSQGMAEYVTSPLLNFLEAYWIPFCIYIFIIGGIWTILNSFNENKQFKNKSHAKNIYVVFSWLLWIPIALCLLWGLIAVIFQIMYFVLSVLLRVIGIDIYPSIGLVIIFSLILSGFVIYFLSDKKS